MKDILIKDKTLQSTLVFFVNGKKVEDDKVDPEWTLLYYLRNKLRLCGTKLGCGEGGCGACTVMVSKYERDKKKILHFAVNACLAPICSMHGLAVTTVEGIGSTKTKLHPVQERIAQAHGSQCGFCTPGIVMSMYALLRSLPGKPTLHDMEIALQGNLCRCTGYRPIIEGFKTFTEEWESARLMNGNGLQNGNGVCGMGENCCKNKKKSSPETEEEKEKLFSTSEFTPYDKSQEPIFPPELQLSDVYDADSLIIKGPRVTWYRPKTYDELLNLKKDFPDAKIVVGNSEVGVEVKFKKFVYSTLIQPALIKELSQYKVAPNGIWLGGAVTLNDLKSILKQQNLPSSKTRIYVAIVEMLHWFAGNQIRNVAAIAGNIMTGSPISDLNPILLAARCKLQLESAANGVREVAMDGSFFTSYRKNIVRPDEVLKAIFIPHTSSSQYFKAYKQARRREDDIAIVNAAFNVTFESDESDSLIVKDCEFAFGGMAATTVLARKTKDHLINKVWNESLLESTWLKLIEDLPLDASAPGGMIQYRRSLPLSLFHKFFITINNELKAESVPSREKSAANTFKTLPTKSSQYFQIVPSTQEKSDLVGRPIVHASAFKQATGEAVYCDDIPKYENELYLAFVTSSRPHAKILSIDTSAALKMKGVHTWVDEKDVPGNRNFVGSVVHDDQVFARDVVEAVGQVIGAIVAEDQLIAQRAAQLVQVSYEDLPAIFSIDEAIQNKSFFGEPLFRNKGDVDEVFKRAKHVIEDEVAMGGQEHFYLETHAAVAVPKNEDTCMEVFVSSQHPSEIQEQVAHVLGVHKNRIVARVKRLGGGFGGKEARAYVVSIPCAIAANKLGRPVRCMLDRDEDIGMTGQRHPFKGKYKVAFDDSGKLEALDFKLYNNAGCSTDLSCAVMNRACGHVVNAFSAPNIRVEGFVCKTNVASNTAFRAFGAPQAMFVGETMGAHVAHYLKQDYASFARKNLCTTGYVTHLNQTMEHCTIERCFDEVKANSAYDEKRKQVTEFNRLNRYRKRGLAIVPTVFGIAFETAFLNQAGALVLIYTDGSVLVSHSGTEMGQGLHTKMIQVTGRALGISTDLIFVNETATDKVPNTSPTAASVGSDLNGMAILDACETLNKRLAPYKEKNPKGQWKDWVKAAFFDRVSLSATGFYKTPDIGYNAKTNQGKACNYYCYGASVSEVEIDCLTGDHQVRSTDIVMDIGESLNPAIDVGQIEGAFMQGYGLLVMEELMYSPRGMIYTRGPGTYKIPGFADIPAQFNVSLLKGAPNPRAIYSSKAVGEPPLLLATSVFFALRDAISAARKETGMDDFFRLDAPATPAKIRMLCVDNITAKFPEPAPGTFKAWSIEIT